MGKNWYFYLLIIVNLVLISRMPALAQTGDPKTIKFKSFTPPPTRTPTKTPTATRTPIPTSIPYYSPTQAPIGYKTPTPYGAKSPTPTLGGGGGNPEDCAKLGLSMFEPQPRYLENTTLCDLGTIWPGFSRSFVPSNLVNLKNALNNKWWIRRREIEYKSGLIANLDDLLRYISKSCEPFVGYAYRSYAEQEALYYGKNCPTNPGCGVAPPGKSTHQAGIAVDLFCVRLVNGVAQIYEVPSASIANSRSFDFIHPVSWDTPHFIGL